MSEPQLLSVNVSLPRTVIHRGQPVVTGIFKQPVNGRIPLTFLNLQGDRQADLAVHGGRDKAVYAYPFEHYAVWQQELGRKDFQYGQFGENFTLTAMTEDIVHVGDVFQVGTAVLQITQPRVPCYKLGIRFNTPQFPKLFMASSHTGYYFRVLQEGVVEAGDKIHRLQEDPIQLSVRDIFQLMYYQVDDLKTAERALQIEALAPGWRDAFAARLGEKITNQ